MNNAGIADRSHIRIATVYRNQEFQTYEAHDMSLVRWLRISEGLAQAGYSVDMIVNTSNGLVHRSPRLRFVPFTDVNWDHYHAIKTLFHRGFRTLREAGGHIHPFIISKLGSVVGSDDNVEGVYFFAQEREELFDIQLDIAQHSRYVSVLTPLSRELWHQEHGTSSKTLLVQTGVDKGLPLVKRNPYLQFPEKIALYMGNIYTNTQIEINRLWTQRLNELGKTLREKGIRLCFLGPGNTERLKADYVTNLGVVDEPGTWDYLYFADVGVVLAQGVGQHNESSKLYYYLRAGLPTVSEEYVPNNSLIEKTQLGLISPYNDPVAMAELIGEAMYRNWDNFHGIQYMLNYHLWTHRILTYEAVIDEYLSSPGNR